MSILTAKEDINDTKETSKCEGKNTTSTKKGIINDQEKIKKEFKDTQDINTNNEGVKIIEENDKCIEAKEIISNTELIEIKPVLRQRRGRQGRNEVKIYDRVIEGKLESN